MNKKILSGVLPQRWSADLVSERRFPPLELQWRPESDPNAPWNALLCATAEGLAPVRFAVFYQREATPRQLALAATQLAHRASHKNYLPMLLAPYLSEESLLALQAQAVSALDLCGNGILLAPGQFTVFRTGYPNRFTSSRPLKNAYRGTSSLVARAFLLKPVYPEMNALRQEIARRGGDISLPTVSKAVKELEDDLVVRRDRQAQKPQARTLTLLQPEKLLARLTENYASPRLQNRFVGKVDLEAGALRSALGAHARRSGARLIATGVGSASRYAALAMEPVLYVYTDSLDRLLQGLPAVPTTRFPNLSVEQTEDPTVFFDPRPDETGFPWASPLSAYLEMTRADARLVHSAGQIRASLLESVTASVS